MEKGKYGHLIVTELKAPQFSDEYYRAYSRWAKRILWMDGNVVPGAFQMNCSWYLRPNEPHFTEAHTHNSDEIIGFFGSDPDNPYELYGEVEFWIDDEKHTITKSCLIFIPRGLRHCPLIIRRVERPIFHFNVVNESQYVAIK
jgi:hypothetical protein